MLPRLLTLFAIALCVGPAAAHPIPRDTHDRTITVSLNRAAVLIEYHLEVDEVVAAADLRRDGDGSIPSGEDRHRAYLALLLPDRAGGAAGGPRRPRAGAGVRRAALAPRRTRLLHLAIPGAVAAGGDGRAPIPLLRGQLPRRQAMGRPHDALGQPRHDRDAGTARRRHQAGRTIRAEVERGAGPRGRRGPHGVAARGGAGAPRRARAGRAGWRRRASRCRPGSSAWRGRPRRRRRPSPRLVDLLFDTRRGWLAAAGSSRRGSARPTP